MRLAIPDMECGGCVASVTRAIRAEDATATIAADLATHSVEVTSTLDRARLVAVIEDAGYTVAAA